MPEQPDHSAREADAETLAPPAIANTSSFPGAHVADLSLVRGVHRGDPDASRRFIDRMRCIPKILSVLNARSGRPLDGHDLRDLTQDTLMAVWKKLDRFEGRASLETWAYRFCV